ncbi:hypothetical protein C8035_v010867 [Colletotrichum spinosum]|uniref:Uncharacterized protein n=1 Tax=Colletotrichum spinosum TaxID=1347390 RepID=A0A4R8Q828_9PEZI|nr:hypothetical protein C8035_v010867 [Colletotrichum spinosum]
MSFLESSHADDNADNSDKENDPRHVRNEVREFAIFHQRLRKLDPPFKSEVKMISREYPHGNKAQRFNRWVAQDCGDYMSRMRKPVTWPDFTRLTANTNFANPLSRGSWLEMMILGNKGAYHIGESSFGGFFTGYALDPGPSYLHAAHSSSNQDPVHESVLAINLDAEEENSPLLFVQLGSISYYRGAGWKKARDSNWDTQAKGPWTPTGFGLVVQISSSGLPQGVFSVFNNYLLNPEDDSYVPMGFPPACSGRLFKHDFVPHEHCDPQHGFIVAKVAENVQQLGPKFNIPFRVIKTTSGGYNAANLLPVRHIIDSTGRDFLVA